MSTIQLKTFSVFEYTQQGLNHSICKLFIVFSCFYVLLLCPTSVDTVTYSLILTSFALSTLWPATSINETNKDGARNE